MHNIIDWQSIIESINWTTILASALSASIIGSFVAVGQFLTTRYLGRLLDHIEKPTRIRKRAKK